MKKESILEKIVRGSLLFDNSNIYTLGFCSETVCLETAVDIANNILNDFLVVEGYNKNYRLKKNEIDIYNNNNKPYISHLTLEEFEIKRENMYFDIQKDKLYDINIVNLNNEDYKICIIFHHIITDLFGLKVFLNTEFSHKVIEEKIYIENNVIEISNSENPRNCLNSKSLARNICLHDERLSDPLKTLHIAKKLVHFLKGVDNYNYKTIINGRNFDRENYLGYYLMEKLDTSNIGDSYDVSEIKYYDLFEEQSTMKSNLEETIDALIFLQQEKKFDTKFGIRFMEDKITKKSQIYNIVCEVGSNNIELSLKDASFKETEILKIFKSIVDKYLNEKDPRYDFIRDKIILKGIEVEFKS